MSAQLRRDPVLVALVAIGAVLIGWFALDAGGDTVQLRVFWSVVPFFDLLMWHFARRVAALPDVPPAERRFWRRAGLMMAFFVVGDTSQTAVVWLRPGPGGAVPNLFQAGAIVAGVCWLIWVMLTHPTPITSRVAKVRFWLDAGSVLVGAAVLIWLLLLPHDQTGQPAGAPIALLLGSVILAFAAFAAVKLVLSGNAPMSTVATAPMIAAAVIQGAVGALVTPDGRALNLLLGAQLLAATLVMIGPRLQEHAVRFRLHRPAPNARRPYSLLPYTTLAGMFAALPVVLRDGLGPRGWLLLGGLLAVTVLVVVRQLLAFGENAMLLRDLGAQEERFRSLLAHSTDITSIVDADGLFSYLSPATERVLGKAPASALGTPYSAHIHPDDLPTVMSVLSALRQEPNATIAYQARYAHGDGSWRWLDVVTRNLLHVPSVRGYVGNARDVTQARVLQDELRRQATHDGLTGLANRALFDERLTAAAGAGVAAVLLVDLNDFKTINDTHGHHAGDAVLVGVAERLAASVPAGGTAARIGGDEFAVLLPGCDATAAALVAERFLGLLDAPVPVEGHLLAVRASVGIVDGDPSRPEDLLRRADAQMYQAKRDNRAIGASA